MTSTTTTVAAPSLSPRTTVGMALGAFLLGGALAIAAVVVVDGGTSTDTVRPSITGAEYEASADARQQSSAGFGGEVDGSLLDRSISATDHVDAGGATPSVLDRSIAAIDHADGR